MLYCADSPSLACLETLVHLGAGNLPLKRYLVAIDIADKLWNTRQITDLKSLPIAWNAFPAMQTSCNIGDDWLMRNDSGLLVVPSAIVPEDSVILLNPQHPDVKRQVKASKMRAWHYDQRLLKV